jgi:hypothetical protein
MKLANRIVLINIGIAVFLTILVLLSDGGFKFSRGNDTAFAFGIVCLLLGIITIFIGFILLFTSKTEWRQGFLLSGAVLLLLSGVSCGGGAMM